MLKSYEKSSSKKIFIAKSSFYGKVGEIAFSLDVITVKIANTGNVIIFFFATLLATNILGL